MGARGGHGNFHHHHRGISIESRLCLLLMLILMQKIVYPYAWGKYNVLILPPSFPYGGMENPIFTFATPSIISKVRFTGKSV